MKFGKLSDISDVDWTIPPDDPLGREFCANLGPPRGLKIFFGAPAWGHAAWVGKIYPEGTKRQDYLSHYSSYFSCIELNTTHYRIPNAEQVSLWRKQVPHDFLFCPKIVQGISHERNGLLDQKILSEWLHFLKLLEGNLGPSFLQLPPHFSYAHKAELFHFLKNWPDEFELAIEFRHPTWFENGHLLPALSRYLQSRKIGTVITDVAGRRDLIHASITSDFCLIRFVGNDLHESDFERARTWTKRFAAWKTAGLKKLFLFIHEPDDINVPEMTEFFLDQLKTADLVESLPQTQIKVKQQLSLADELH